MIIFDLDGTLWNTEKTCLKAAQEIVKKYDELQDITLDMVRKGMGLSEIDNARNYMPYLDDDKALYYLRLIDSTNRKYIENEGAMVYTGVVDTIKKLCKNYRLGIVTNSTTSYAENFFKVSGLKEYFFDYMGAASYSLTKGETIKAMIQKDNGVNSFYVGDIEKDMISAKEAGVNFIHAKYGFGTKLNTKYSINDISELPDLLDNINFNTVITKLYK